MSVSIFNERELEEDLSDVRVDASGVSEHTVNRVKRWVKRGTTAVASLASKYSHKTGLGFSALKSYFGNRRYRLEPVREEGVGGYFDPRNGSLVINSKYAEMNNPFAMETAYHEAWHDLRHLNGSMENLRTGLYKTFSYLGGFGKLVADYVHRVYEEMAATRLTEKNYNSMGLGRIRGYPSLQPRLGMLERAVGEEKLVYNTEADAPVIAHAVLSALA